MPTSFLARWRPWLLGVVTILTAGCDNDCDFGSRCNGNVVEVCGEGPDQLVGRRIQATPCEGSNSVCADHNEVVQCVAPARTECLTSDAPRCQDGAIVSCGESGYEQIKVCDPEYSVCHQGGPVHPATCVYAPGVSCGDSFASHCEGKLVLSCSPQHLVVATDCTKDSGDSPASTCVSDAVGVHCD